MIYKDQLNREIIINALPKRIISLVPSQTEMFVYLGLGTSIVGLTKFCVHPKNLIKIKKVVGGTKTVRLDKIASLSPDLIICNKEENTQDIVADCSKIAPVWVSDIKSIDDNISMILQLGEIFKIPKASQDLVVKIKDKKADFLSFILNKAPKKVAYCIWKNPYMVAAADTFIDELISLNNFNNVFSNRKERYPQINVNELRGIDLVLLSSEPYPFKEKDLLELKNELQCEVRLVDGEYFSWYGSRILEAFTYFKTLH